MLIQFQSLFRGGDAFWHRGGLTQNASKDQPNAYFPRTLTSECTGKTHGSVSFANIVGPIFQKAPCQVIPRVQAQAPFDRGACSCHLTQAPKQMAVRSMDESIVG